jgi:hypothetical protein
MVDHQPELGIPTQHLGSVLDLIQQRIVCREAVLGDPPLVRFVEHAASVDRVGDRDGHVSVLRVRCASHGARP